MRFRLRLHNPRLYTGNPDGLVLEITETYADGSECVFPFKVTRSDLAALNSLMVQLNSGVPLPVETSGEQPSMTTGSFPRVGTGPMRHQGR